MMSDITPVTVAGYVKLHNLPLHKYPTEVPALVRGFVKEVLETPAATRVSAVEADVFVLVVADLAQLGALKADVLASVKGALSNIPMHTGMICYPEMAAGYPCEFLCFASCELTGFNGPFGWLRMCLGMILDYSGLVDHILMIL
jgi:hypothetical protein